MKKPKPNAAPSRHVAPDLSKQTVASAPAAVSAISEAVSRKIEADVTRTVAQMAKVTQFALGLDGLRSITEIAVGNLAAVVVDGVVDGVRFGPNSEIERLEPLELMEAGAFLYSLGVTLRGRQLTELAVETGSSGQ